MRYGGSNSTSITQYVNTINSRGQTLAIPRQLQGLVKQTNVNVTRLQRVPSNTRNTAEDRKRSWRRRLLILSGILLPALIIAAVVSAVVIGNSVQNSTTLSNSLPSNIPTTTTSVTTTFSTTSSSSTTSSTSTTTSATSTTSTTTSTTTTAPPSRICTTNTSGALLYANQFIYSPTHQLYAAGMLNNQFGVYNAYSYLNVTTIAIWTAGQTSTPSGALFAAQTDRNLVVYASNGAVLWTAAIFISGLSAVFCLQMLDSGNLVWMDSSSTIVWQTNTTINSG